MTVLTRAEDIALEIQRRLELIRTTNGFETDAGAFISRGNRWTDISRAPCCVLIEGADHPQTQMTSSGELKLSQDYVIAAILACDIDQPNDTAHKALRDLKRVMFTGADGTPNSTFDKRVKQVTYRARDIQPRADGKAFVVTVFEFSVEYAEKLYAP